MAKNFKPENFMSVAKRTRVRDRIVVDSYTGKWQAALQTRRLPEVGQVMAIAEDGDAREWDDFMAALRAANCVVLMTGTQDREGRNLGVVIEHQPRQEGEVLIW
jgi:hypothetical protein